jgi:hypothetical protein
MAIDMHCVTNCWSHSMWLPENVDPLCRPLVCQAWCGFSVEDHGEELMPFETYSPYVFEATNGLQLEDVDWLVLEGGERIEILSPLSGNSFEFMPFRNGPVRVRATNQLCTFTCQVESETVLQLVDTDGDGLPNAWETLWPDALDIFNPLDAEQDPDLDGIKNLYEYAYKSNPTTPDAPDDTDGDGIPDLCELSVGSNPADPADPENADLDTDLDAVPDYYEICVFLTDQHDADTDADGLPDGWEIGFGLNPFLNSDTWPDVDGDGYANIFEYFVGTNPKDLLDWPSTEFDADQDGILNWIESVYGTDPQDALSEPEPSEMVFVGNDIPWMLTDVSFFTLPSSITKVCEGDCFSLHATGAADAWEAILGGPLLWIASEDSTDSCYSGWWCAITEGKVVITAGTTLDGLGAASFGALTIFVEPMEECEEPCTVDITTCDGSDPPLGILVGDEICLKASGVDGPGTYSWKVLEFAEIVGPSEGTSVTVRITQPGQVVVGASKGGCGGSITFQTYDVDLNIDSNNDGATNELDDEIEGSPPGQIIQANLLDGDGDGIPNFADGFDLLGELEEDDDVSAGQFIPVKLTIKFDESVTGPEGPPVIFSFSESPADAVEVSLEETPTFKAAPGNLRLWKKIAAERNPADVTQGGDAIHANQAYFASDLGISPEEPVTLWAEAVRWSAEPGDIGLTVSVSGCADSVKLTALASRFVQVRANGTFEPVPSPQLSTPAPNVSATTLLLTNARASADGLTIIADLLVAGTLDDAFSDTVEGPDGSITTLGVRLNGEVARLESGTQVTIPVFASKVEQPDSARAPFDYSGTFSSFVPGVVIQPGREPS